MATTTDEALVLACKKHSAPFSADSPGPDMVRWLSERIAELEADREGWIQSDQQSQHQKHQWRGRAENAEAKVKEQADIIEGMQDQIEAHHAEGRSAGHMSEGNNNG